MPSYHQIVPQDGWDWDYGGTRGYPNESEYTVVKVDFYNDIEAYLAELNNTNIRSLEDIMQYNIDNLGTEGGYPNTHPAFGSGQDGFDASLATKGILDEVILPSAKNSLNGLPERKVSMALLPPYPQTIPVGRPNLMLYLLRQM